MTDKQEKSTEKSLSSFGNLPSAFEYFDDILQITKNYRAMICLDYDGTLTPIVENPEDAVISDEMRDQVRALAVKIPVAIVSGRDLAFIKKHVQLEEVYYAGSHGFEIKGPDDFHHEQEKAREVLPLLDQVEEELHAAFDSTNGVSIERKKYGIAIHYRKAEEGQVPGVKKKIEELLAGHSQLKKGTGKKVIEVKPNIDWDKGHAVHFISKHLTGGSEDGAEIYFGDDITDEDAFRAIEQGAGILVGSHDEHSAADYRLENVNEVRDFLHRLTQNL